MNSSLLAFAKETYNAHIAIVEENNLRRLYQWKEVRRSVGDVIERAYPLEFKLKLTNGTMIYFFVVSRSEQLQGLQFDRIETSPVTALESPWFFMNRLKPNIPPEVGMSWRFAVVDY